MRCYLWKPSERGCYVTRVPRARRHRRWCPCRATLCSSAARASPRSSSRALQPAGCQQKRNRTKKCTRREARCIEGDATPYNECGALVDRLCRRGHHHGVNHEPCSQRDVNRDEKHTRRGARCSMHVSIIITRYDKREDLTCIAVAVALPWMQPAYETAREPRSAALHGRSILNTAAHDQFIRNISPTRISTTIGCLLRSHSPTCSHHTRMPLCDSHGI